MVYVLGGGVLRKDLGDVEQYDYAANKWTVLQVRLTLARNDSPAVCVSGRIFIVGGTSGKNADRNAQKSVECFDPAEKRFSKVSPLSQACPRSAAASVRVSASVLKRLFEPAYAS